jgi:hypothetical protein
MLSIRNAKGGNLSPGEVLRQACLLRWSNQPGAAARVESAASQVQRRGEGVEAHRQQCMPRPATWSDQWS